MTLLILSIILGGVSVLVILSEVTLFLDVDLNVFNLLMFDKSSFLEVEVAIIIIMKRSFASSRCCTCCTALSTVC
jgi:hypothetical protein